MTKEALMQMLNEINAGLKTALTRVNELVAENKALKEALAQDEKGLFIDLIAQHEGLAEELAQAEQEPVAITEQQAHDIGAKGAEPTEAERMLFEAWMRGHCWALSATWTDGHYSSDAEQGSNFDPHAMRTRGLWAAWRDRAALGNAAPSPLPVQPEQGPLEELRQMMQIEVDRLIAAKAPKRQPLTLNEISAMEEKVYMRTTHKGKPLFEYAQALIRAVEAAHGIKENT